MTTVVLLVDGMSYTLIAGSSVEQRNDAISAAFAQFFGSLALVAA